MKWILGFAALSAALAVPLGHLTPQAAHATTSNNCKKKNPSKDCGTALTVASYSGQFQIPVLGTHIVLKGQASKSTHGAQIFAQRTTASHTPKNGVAFRVFVVGHLPRLSLVGRGHLDEYQLGRGSWARVQAITHPGVYAGVT
jgi:hypothetical protein